MSRSVVTDFLQGMRFHVDVDAFDGSTRLQPGEIQAGFNSVTLPEATTEATEYREGQYIYTRKYPGLPTVSDITMTRGVTRKDSTFWDWMRQVIEGSGEYRANLSIKHYHRDSFLGRSFRPGQVPAVPDFNTVSEVDPGKLVPSITYRCYCAFPIRHKVAADLDATSAEVSIMELDVAIEYFEVERNPEPGEFAVAG
jgi:phage tail-like protein